MRTFLATVTGTLAACLLALFSARLVTGHWLFFTPSSFQIQGAVAVLALSLLSFVFRRHWLNVMLIVAAAGIAAHGYLALTSFRQEAETAAQVPVLKLLSFNIMGNNMPGGKRLAQYIVDSGADVVFLQESAPIGPFIPQIRAVYPYRLGCGAQTITCDQSLWSKRPIEPGIVKTASPIYRDRLMLATIDFDGRKVNFANVHLTKPFFDNFHEIELAKIAMAIEPFKDNLVLAGDFNASILPADVQNFLRRTKLRTADSEPNTWPVDAPAIGMAIDHVFTSKPLRITSLTRVPDPIGSNHFGLIAEISGPEVTPPQQ